MTGVWRGEFIWLILAVLGVYEGKIKQNKKDSRLTLPPCLAGCLDCSQCATAPGTSAGLQDCSVRPPSPTVCPPTARYCLILKEYNPSLTDDADAAGDETAGSLHFLARTCVGENVGDTCSTGNKSSTGKIVTVCRYLHTKTRSEDL